MSNNQSDKVKDFYQLHHEKEILVLPNIWNPIGASLLEKTGFQAVATGSGAVANSNGYADGEIIPFDDLLSILERIVRSVRVPVSADVERCYAEDKNTLIEHVKRLADTGICGINYEDSFHDKPGLALYKEQAENIHLIKSAAESVGGNLFLNARTDAYIKAHDLSKEEKLEETIKRTKAYEEAGADGLYPIFLKDKKAIESIVKETSLPVNILLSGGIPNFDELKEIGVKRVSLGSGFFKVALNALKVASEKLKKYDGIEDIVSNPIKPDWIAQLIS